MTFIIFFYVLSVSANNGKNGIWREEGKGANFPVYYEVIDRLVRPNAVERGRVKKSDSSPYYRALEERKNPKPASTETPNFSDYYDTLNRSVRPKASKEDQSSKSANRKCEETFTK